MNFGEALELLKLGRQVCRKGWNGKNMYLGVVEGGGFRDGYRSQDFIYLKTAKDTVVPWVTSQDDVFAEDWELTNASFGN